MPVSAPPRPPRPSDPVTHGEIDALVEALIEEARRRGRRRRRRNGAIVTLVALFGVVLFALLGRSGQSETATPALSARSSISAAVASSKIAFVRNAVYHSKNPRDVGVFVMNPDGSGQKRLTRIVPWRHPAWSPDGRKIAFIYSPGRDGPYLYVMNADGSGLRRVVARSALHPAWSPDGRKIAFAGDELSSGEGGEIYVVDADGSDERRLTQNSASDTVPAWSPDGRKIAFNSDRDGNTEIYVMNADGGDLRNLTRTAVDDGFPLTGEGVSPHNGVWSPDGRTIAFMRGFEDFDRGLLDPTAGIYLMNADGSNQRLLTHAAPGDFAWSPTGSQIAFGGGLRGGPLFVVNADGSGRRTLVRTQPGPRGGAPVSLAWSSDGRKIAFTDGDVNVMNAGGSGRRTLTHSRNLERWFAWSPALR